MNLETVTAHSPVLQFEVELEGGAELTMKELTIQYQGQDYVLPAEAIPIVNREEKTELAGHLVQDSEGDLAVFLDEIVWNGVDIAFSEWGESGLTLIAALFTVMVPPNSVNTENATGQCYCLAPRPPKPATPEQTNAEEPSQWMKRGR